MLRQRVALGVEEGAAVLVLGDPAAGEGAVLDVAEHRAHAGLGLLVGDDPRAGDVLAVLGGVGDGVVHGRDAALVDQVDDELHLVDALEVGVLRLVTGLHQHLEAAAHQVDDAAAEDGLLAEEVGLGLVVHRGLHDARTGAADARDVGQGDVLALAGGVLLHGDQAGHALARHVLAADGVAGALRGGHEHVDPGGGHDALVADVEAVGEGDGLALGEIRRDIGLVHVGLVLVVDQDHDHVGLPGGLRDGQDLEAVLFRDGPALAALAEPDDHVAAGIPEVQRVGVALRAVADDRDGLAAERVQVAILLVVHLCHGFVLLFTFIVTLLCFCKSEVGGMK